jgi:hypothetical protein
MEGLQVRQVNADDGSASTGFHRVISLCTITDAVEVLAGATAVTVNVVQATQQIHSERGSIDNVIDVMANISDDDASLRKIFNAGIINHLTGYYHWSYRFIRNLWFSRHR